jgi:hypothetical protein
MKLLAENSIPVLCFGTFFTLLLREGVNELSQKEHDRKVKKYRNDKKNREYTEGAVFEELNRIITPSFKSGNVETRNVQASKFKSCVSQNAKNLPIVNASDVKTFLIRFKSDYDSVFKNMSQFITNYIHADVSQRKRLVKSLLELIRDDKDIGLDQKFYIKGPDNALSKKELLHERTFSFTMFLNGIFRYIVEIRRNDNLKGQSTYKKWCPPANQGIRVYSDDIYVGGTIYGEITLTEDNKLSLPSSNCEKYADVDISDLTGIDKADYLKYEATMYKSNQDYEKAIQLYYESWQIYQDVTGINSQCVKKIYKIMEDLHKQLNISYPFKAWLKNVGVVSETH